jgi:hypothetical protein
MFALLARAHAGEADHAATIVAARATGAVVLEHGHGEGLAGGGVAVERPLGHGWAVEGAVSELVGREVTELPVELVVEHEWEVGEHLEPYVGAGPTMTLRSDGAGSELLPGGVAVAGARWWLSEHVGLLVEADATARSGAVGAEGITGIALRWR